MVVLSGMSSMEQMEDNLSFMRDFKPLDEAENAAIEKARITFASIDKIPCTSCGYCVPGCPMEIRIPNIFRVMNTYKVYGQLAVAKREYNFARGSSSASDCICFRLYRMRSVRGSMSAASADHRSARGSGGGPGGVIPEKTSFTAWMRRCFEPGIHTDQV